MFKIDIEKLPSFQIGEEKGLEQGLRQGVKQGLRQGVEQGLEKVAKNLLSKNNDIAFIADVTGLSTKEIERLK